MTATQSKFRSALLLGSDVPLGQDGREVLRQAGVKFRRVRDGNKLLSAVRRDRAELCLIGIESARDPVLTVVQELVQSHPEIPIVLFCADKGLVSKLRSMNLGESEFLVDPKPDEFSEALQSAFNRKPPLEGAVADRPELVGPSKAMNQIRRLISKAAPSDIPILVTGETGTGKEMVARAIHAESARSGGPFVGVNSAALTDTLLESELFGHEKGAFTGAADRRRGQFEQANGGTIFLDEIGDMPPATQAKILRVLQERALKRVGGEETLNVDVRVICASNRDLKDLVRRGRFREDLYYRINPLIIAVPPLRERGEDILALTDYFMRKSAALEGRQVPTVSEAARECLVRYGWPGNVRELEHALSRCLLLAESGKILPEHLPEDVRHNRPPKRRRPRSLPEAVEELERTIILEALDRNNWVKARAAREIGITKRAISYKMIKLGIEKPH